MSTSTPARKKDKRLEIRTTSADRELFARAAEATGTDVTGFANEHLRIAAQRILADRTEFLLDEQQWEAWQELLDRPARDLPGLRRLMERPSPWAD